MSMSAAPTNTPWPRGCGAGTTSTPSQMSVSPRQIATHLHPRHPPEAGRGRTNHGQLYGAGHVSKKRLKNTGEKAKASSPVLFGSIGIFPRVGHGVGQAVAPHFDPHHFRRFCSNKYPPAKPGVFILRAKPYVTSHASCGVGTTCHLHRLSSPHWYKSVIFSFSYSCHS